MSWDELFKFFVAIGSLASILISIYTTNHSAKREAVTDLYRIVDELKAEIKDLKDERDALSDWAHRLVNQVVGAGMKPVPYRKNDD